MKRRVNSIRAHVVLLPALAAIDLLYFFPSFIRKKKVVHLAAQGICAIISALDQSRCPLKFGHRQIKLSWNSLTSASYWQSVAFLASLNGIDITNLWMCVEDGPFLDVVQAPRGPNVYGVTRGRFPTIFHLVVWFWGPNDITRWTTAVADDLRPAGKSFSEFMTGFVPIFENTDQDSTSITQVVRCRWALNKWPLLRKRGVSWTTLEYFKISAWFGTYFLPCWHWKVRPSHHCLLLCGLI